MKKRWKNSILTKLLFGTVLVLLIPFIVANSYVYRVNYKSSLERTVEENKAMLGVGLDSLEEYFKRLNQIMLSVYENTSLHAILQSNSAFTESEIYSIREELGNMVEKDTSIRQAELICRNGQTVTQEEIGADNEKDWRSAIYKSSRIGIKSGYDVNGKLTVLKYGRQLEDEPSSDMLVQVNFYCVLNRLESISEKVGAGEKNDNNAANVAIYLEDSKDPLFSSMQINEVVYQRYEDGYSVGSLNGTNGFFFTGASEYFGQKLRIVKFVPESTIVAPINQMIWRMVVSQGVVLVCVILFLLFIYKNMIKPIKNIAKNIDQVREGQYKYHAVSNSQDEIGELDRKYEEMVGTIHTLVNKDLKNALEISKTRLKMLQAQINPHFLNNILQSISTQAVKAGDREASNSLAKLARMLQYNMDTSTDFVTVAAELKQIRLYLDLQQSRFRERLQYEIDCEKDLESVIVPKMLIQPLVENSMNHGLSKLEGIGRIQIKIYKEDRITIEVIDNGSGISKEKIQQLQGDYKNYESSPEAGHGIGFVNVIQRMELYAEDFSWDVKSTPYVETKIILRFRISE